MEANYSPLINRALQLFHVRERIAQPTDLENSFLNPFITVARDPGSGGAPIAKAVADALGFEFIDDVIVEEIARSTRKRSAIIKEIDEKNRSKIEDIVHSLLNVEYVDEESYITALVRILLSYAHKGKCVILGRGANFITPFGKGLHVSITAPYEIRLQRAMDYEGHSREKAKEVVAKTEEARNEFVHQYFKANAKQRNAFDVTINTAYFTVPQARDIIIESFHQKFRR
jgi:cytidylate kinase